MSRLLVLWLLAERSSYGYEIKKSLTDAGMAFWFALEDASIYSALRTLVRHGYASEVGVEQDPGRPQRTRYAITPAGRRHYQDLLKAGAATVSLPVAGLDVVLAAQGDLSASELQLALETRRSGLLALIAGIDRERGACPHPAIADRNRALLAAELRWLDEFTQPLHTNL
jgi:DNA-binding PadR family transcriptional regulator